MFVSQATKLSKKQQQSIRPFSWNTQLRILLEMSLQFVSNDIIDHNSVEWVFFKKPIILNNNDPIQRRVDALPGRTFHGTNLWYMHICSCSLDAVDVFMWDHGQQQIRVPTTHRRLCMLSSRSHWSTRIIIRYVIISLFHFKCVS